MYTPPEFKITDKDVIDAFLKENGFGILISSKTGKPIASHLPFVMDYENGKQVFYTHLANDNVLSALENEDEVLLIFQGEHGYVSSSWYVSTNVPTWNYQAVHVYGQVERLSEEELYKQLKKLTADYENSVEGNINPDELPQRMIQSYLQFITGLKITATSVEATFKLSQNRNQKDFDLVIKELEQRNPKLAEVMKANYQKKSE